MKNVIWLFAVCLSIGFYACSTNSNEKVANEVETPDLVNENTDVSDETDSLENSLVSEGGTEEIAEEVVEKTEEKEKKAASGKPGRKADPSLSMTKADAVKSNPPKSRPTSTPLETVVQKPKKDEVAPPPPRPAAPTSNPKPEATKPARQLDHGPWDNLLKSNVSSSGVVDYAGFKAKKSELEAYLRHLDELSPQSDWSKDKRLSYWINLYNAWTVKTIVDNYPLASITDIDGGKTWNVKRVKSGGKTYSLDEIENQIIRPRFNDGRIHFAVNCAAKSCPPLMNRAWSEDRLNKDLEKMTKAFINNSNHNSISNDKLVLSQIFEWYADDFGDLITFLNKYSNVTISKTAKVEYDKYDWALNGK